MFNNINKPILAIETSLGKCSVALLCGDRASFIDSDKSSMQSELLFPMIQEILKKENIKIADLGAIVCTIGPGSFTGVRIGIAAARGIKHVFKDIKLLGISTLELLAYSARETAAGKSVISLIEARREEFYMQKFNSDLQPLQDIEVVTLSELDTKQFMVSNVILEGNALITVPNAKLLLERGIELLSDGVEHKNIYPIYVKDPNIT